METSEYPYFERNHDTELDSTDLFFAGLRVPGQVRERLQVVRPASVWSAQERAQDGRQRGPLRRTHEHDEAGMMLNGIGIDFDMWNTNILGLHTRKKGDRVSRGIVLCWQ